MREASGALGPLALGLLVAASGRSATITVTSAADAHADGQCTLREAIVAANTNTASGGTPGDCAAGDSGHDTIEFAIPGAGVHTIAPGSAFPAISEAVTIDGYSQPGASANTLSAGNDAVILIEIDASAAGSLLGGLFDIQAGPSTIQGLSVNRVQGGNSAAIRVAANGSTISGNFIGVDPSGAIARANGCNGVRVESSGNAIGGSTPAARNVISATGGCGINLVISGNDNAVLGNVIGSNASGTSALGGLGIDLSDDATGNTVGGTTPAESNLISGNDLGGIRVRDAGTSANKTQGNLIGTNAAGTGPLPNGYGFEISNGAHDNAIGGDFVSAGNVIAFNAAGVRILSTGGSGNAILSNSIFSNSGLAIDLDNDGVTPNDPKDADAGPNGLQNFPILTSVTESGVEGTLSAAPSANFTIQFFANEACDPSGFGEGQTLIQTAVVSTNAGGSVSFGVSMTVPPGQAVTATATDAAGNTSEFSPCTLLIPAAIGVDPAAGAASDGNGVFEPGESVSVEPSWSNPTGTAIATGGGASNPIGPPVTTYTILDSTADYGAIAAGAIASCSATANCYAVCATAGGPRPATHWDMQFRETLTGAASASHLWTLHLGDSFADVPRTHPFYKKIEAVLHNGITVGCAGTQYCPAQKVPRDQMAIFLARAIARGGANIPSSGTVGALAYNCAPAGTSLFTDVSPTDASCKSVHYIAGQNVTSGCGSGMFCPSRLVTRAEMAIFVAKGIVAPGGGAAVPAAYGPDPATGRSYSCNAGSPDLHFSDVPASDSSCKHVHFLWAKGVIAGCSATQYCPTGQVGRDEMAKFLSNAFGIQLYGP